MESGIKISIILPSLNVAAYIEECITSAINQTLKEIEIICVDAGSEDGTYEILKGYAERDERVQLINSDVRSYGAQVNIGLQKSHGKYIAILETDDYARADMYEKLYIVAEKTNVDYVKGDYTSFYTMDNGERFFEEIKQFYDEPNLYGRVINPHKEDILYRWDAGLWRGIYNRDFLQRNNIWFNETPGAAYQDISFKEKVLFMAKSAYYVEDHLYFYRTDREDASQYSLQSLYNSWIEFLLLNEWENIRGDIFYEKGHFIYMVIVFVREYHNTIIRCDYDEHRKECEHYYWWFSHKIRFAFDRGIISMEDFTEDTFEELSLILHDLDSYKRYLKEKISLIDSVLSRQLEQKKEIVIYGSGHQGKMIAKYLNAKGRFGDIVSFADNSSEKQGRTIVGIQVTSLEDSIEKYPNADFVIANEKYTDEMEEQYIFAGGERERLIRIWG